MKVDYDSLSADYARHRRIHPGVLNALLEKSGPDESSNILEVGCGTGNYITAVHSTVNGDCTGIDPSAGMLETARQASPAVRFMIGKAEKLDFPAHSFDLLFSVDVIHHVGDQQAFFREAARVLKSHGLICTVTDSEDIIRRRQPLSNYFPETVEAELKRYPRIEDLRKMMEAAGFTWMEEKLVEFHTTTMDIEAYRQKVFSSLLYISSATFEAGIAKMEADLQQGPIPVVSRYMLLWGKNEAD